MKKIYTKKENRGCEVVSPNYSWDSNPGHLQRAPPWPTPHPDHTCDVLDMLVSPGALSFSLSCSLLAQAVVLRAQCY